MTVSYSKFVTESSGVGSFWKLLLRWRGSVYKLIWHDLLLYLSLYTLLSLVYRFALNEDQRLIFEEISLHCNKISDIRTLSFVLSFYVSLVVKRWWDQFSCIPRIGSLSLYVSTTIHGQDKRARMIRRTIMRYTNLAITITFTFLSPRMKKQFPTLDSFIHEGLLHSNESKIIKDIVENSGQKGYWIPLVWAGSIVSRARKEGRISDDYKVQTLLFEINKIRSRCSDLLNYEWISIPLVYTQVLPADKVVTIAVYTFFLASLFGRQFLSPKKEHPDHKIDFYMPIFSILQFLFYMGWLKVAESLINPFGDDDDDFEVCRITDKNLKVSYLIVDDLHNEYPELLQDMYWDQAFPEMPYIRDSKYSRKSGKKGGTVKIAVEKKEPETPEEKEKEFERTAL